MPKKKSKVCPRRDSFTWTEPEPWNVSDLSQHPIHPFFALFRFPVTDYGDDFIPRRGSAWGFALNLDWYSHMSEDGDGVDTEGIFEVLERLPCAACYPDPVRVLERPFENLCELLAGAYSVVGSFGQGWDGWLCYRSDYAADVFDPAEVKVLLDGNYRPLCCPHDPRPRTSLVCFCGASTCLDGIDPRTGLRVLPAE